MSPSRREFLCAAALVAAAAGTSWAESGAPSVPAGSTKPFLPFSAASYWNSAIPTDAPIDDESAKFIDDFKKNSKTHLRLVLSEKWSNPVYWAKEGDREFAIQVKDVTYKVRLPKDAYAATGSDRAMTVIDVDRKVTHSLYHAKMDKEKDRWEADGIAVYYTDSNGLDGRLKQSNEPRNEGHRGIPPTIMMVRKDEIEAGLIAHKLEMFAHATGDAHVFPMIGHESKKGGIIPEGMLLRIKPSVDLSKRQLKPGALVIAKAIQTYGMVVGDNSGSGNNLKVERAAIPLFEKDDLAAVAWDDWEVIKRGYGG